MPPKAPGALGGPDALFFNYFWGPGGPPWVGPPYFPYLGLLVQFTLVDMFGMVTM